ncbi:hypothetical protein GCM10010909_16500 [Acidocella aquatica]|uniref:DNA-binding protein n=1 Tax=Acidocella aquatica TaxID=1922313 RepID=A0ABQ6A3A9_9PROT|nr:Zn-ribbon domain-containing OB-fold protein [Acidocella aquatica]GLR66970.1 hypothetical protein GCM10010909_16500 [Acidocella aquatica]
MSETKPLGRKIMSPRILPEVAPFWQAANEGKLLLKRCDDCREVHYYPRDICPHCLSINTSWFASSGEGRIYSFSTMAIKDAVYTLAYVTLDEGVSLLTNILDAEPKTLRIGQRVRAVFWPSEDGQSVTMFTPF